MSKIHLVIPDPHAKPNTSNARALWIGELIKDLKPDVVVNIGDMFDMESLSSYDKGKIQSYGRKYDADINAGLDFDEKLWHAVRKAKKKRPYRVFLEGNHEHRLKRLLEVEHAFDGKMSFNDFNLTRNYDAVVEYDGTTPGNIIIDNINYAHYFISGVKGYAVGGANPAKSLIKHQKMSATCGHLHQLDFAIETNGKGQKVMGLFAGVGHDHYERYAGAANRLWSPGIIIKREVENGMYDIQTVSLNALRKEYG